MKRILALAMVALLLPLVGYADSQRPMTPQDVIRLARAGAGEEVLLSQIDASHEVFTLTVQDILDLKEAGVSDRVITYMINSGKNRTPAGNDGTLGGIDQDRYKTLPGSDAPVNDAAADDSDEYGGARREYDNGYGNNGYGNAYDASAAFGYSSWSPYWTISLGWGFGGYYDPWYCGYWPGYWSYYSPFSCYSSYWRCPPYYAGWCDYGYPYRNDYSYHNPHYRDSRTFKPGDRDLYNRGRAGSGTTVGGTYTSTDFGRTYKGTPVNGTTVGGRGSYANPRPGDGGREYRRVAPQQPGTWNRGRSQSGSSTGWQGRGTPPSRDAGRSVKPAQPGYGTGVAPQGGYNPAPPASNGNSGGREYKAPPPPPSGGGRGNYGGRTAPPTQSAPPVQGRGSSSSSGSDRTMKKG